MGVVIAVHFDGTARIFPFFPVEIVIGCGIHGESRLSDAFKGCDRFGGVDVARAGPAVQGIGGAPSDQADDVLVSVQRQCPTLIFEQDEPFVAECFGDAFPVFDRARFIFAVGGGIVIGIPVFTAFDFDDGGRSFAEVGVGHCFEQ